MNEKYLRIGLSLAGITFAITYFFVVSAMIENQYQQDSKDLALRHLLNQQRIDSLYESMRVAGLFEEPNTTEIDGNESPLVSNYTFLRAGNFSFISTSIFGRNWSVTYDDNYSLESPMFPEGCHEVVCECAKNTSFACLALCFSCEDVND